jgi:amino acid permease
MATPGQMPAAEPAKRCSAQLAKESAKEPAQEPAKEGLDVGLMLNLVLCGLGAGMLSMPWTVAGAGIVNGMIWTFGVLALTYFTVMLLVKAGEKEQCFCFEELVVRAAPGGARAKKIWAMTCTAAVWFSCFLALVGYMVIIGDSVVPTLGAFGAWDKAGLADDQARKAVLVVGMVCIFPLCFLSQRQLEFTSGVGTFSNCFIVFALLLNFFLMVKEESSSSCALSTPFTKGNLSFITNMMMAITVQPCMLPMYAEMNTDPADTSRPQRSPESFAKALRTALVILYLLFCLFASVGYLSYGAAAEGNILNNLPTSQWYTSVSRISMVGVCLGVYPLMLYPMVTPMGERLKPLGVVLINACALCIAFAVSNLGIVNVINGSLGVFFLAGLFPAVVALGVRTGKQAGVGALEEGLLPHTRDGVLEGFWYSAPPMIGLILLSFTVMVLSLQNTTSDAQNLGGHCLWSV